MLPLDVTKLTPDIVSDLHIKALSLEQLAINKESSARVNALWKPSIKALETWREAHAQLQLRTAQRHLFSTLHQAVLRPRNHSTRERGVTNSSS